MPGSPAAKRYAKAFYVNAQTSGDKDRTEADVSFVCKALSQHESIREFVENPVVPPDRQKAVLDQLFGQHLAASSMRILSFLVAKQRLNLLGQICRIYLELCDEERGIVHATITTAKPLSETQVSAICQRLAEKTGKTIEARVDEDPSLLGGFTVQVGDTVTDLSLVQQLTSLRDRIINA